MAALVTALGFTVWLTLEHRRLLHDSGLRAEYRAGATWDGPPEFTAIENGISEALVQRRSQERHGAPFTATWRGYLIAPAHDRYRFSVLADDRASIEIDKRPVVEGDRTRRESSIELTRGLHPITVRYYDGFGQQRLDVRWARTYGPHDHIPGILLIPDLVGGEAAQRRTRVWQWTSRLPLVWAVMVISALTGALVYRVTTANTGVPREAGPLLLMYAVATVIFVTGISWGLPDYRGWAVDEITPGQIDDFLDHRFANGWATIYPPVHFGLLALASSPMYLADRLHLAADTVDRYSKLFLIGRVLSVSMAMCILAFVYHLVRTELGPRSARFSLICALCIIPLAYYAKTANLDVPYLFWVSASWVAYMRAIRSGSVKYACLFAAIGAVAIATKDQAYAFYVLPAAHLVFQAFRARPSDPSTRPIERRTVLAMAGVFVCALVLLFNAPFNWAGVREHLRVIVGPGSDPFRMYPSTLSGYWKLLQDTVVQISDAMSWPLFVIAIIGVADAIRSKTVLLRHLLLFSLSYYLTFIAIVMYQYDRFFVGICLVFAVAAGTWLDRWTRVGQPFRHVRIAFGGLVITYALARVLSLDLLMLQDSRYFVERWLVDRIGRDTRVAAEGNSVYLPRQTTLLWTRIPPDPVELRTQRSDFLIVNPAHSARPSDEPAANDFYTSLSRGGPYRLALSYRTRLWFSPLNWEPRFNGSSEDQYSNVTKVNPTIEVYERVASGDSR